MKLVFMMYFACFFFCLVDRSDANSTFWTPRDRTLYEKRHFIELQHRLIMANRMTLLRGLQRQEEDLRGCREISHGHGGIDAITKCMGFINRENELGLFTRHRADLIHDIGLLCQSVLVLPSIVEKLIASKAIRGAELRQWKPCNDKAWQQVYLTTYANFETSPVATLAFLRRADAGLHPESSWAKKARLLMEKLPPTSNP